MDEGILSLRWNNHRSTFFHILSTLHQKELYSDVTIACEGKFFPVHKLVLSVCSEYFEDMFKKTNCKHPIIVLKDILCDELEALLNYMYVGEANVAQSDLARLIKAAECLRIKGLAVPDENPESHESKRPNSCIGKEDTSAPKRRKQDESQNKFPSTSRDGHNDGRRDGHNDGRRDGHNDGRRDEHNDGRRDGHNDGRRDGHNDGQSFTVGDSDSSHQSPSSSPKRNSPTSPHRNQRLLSQERRNNSNHGGQVIAEVVLEDEAVVKTEPKIEEEIVLENESLSFETDKQGGISGENQPYNVQPLNQGPHNVLQDIMTQGIPQGSTESIPHWENSGGNHLGGVGGFSLEAFSPDDSSSRASQQMGTSLGSAVRLPPPSGGALLCLFCRRAFMYRSDLNRHMRTHTGEKPYECQHCKYRATQKSHLREHIKRRHPELFLPPTEMLHIKMTPSEMQHNEMQHVELHHTGRQHEDLEHERHHADMEHEMHHTDMEYERQHTEMQYMNTHSSYIENTELQPVNMQHRDIPTSSNQYSSVYPTAIDHNDTLSEMHQREMQYSDNVYSDSEHGNLEDQQSYHPSSSSPSSPINYSTSAEQSSI